MRPEVRVAPYLVVVVTDSRYYADLSRGVFRFLPVRLEPGDVERMHGRNERISLPNYENVIRTYRLLILNLATDHLRTSRQRA